MQTGVWVGLVAASLLGVGAVGASGVIAPAWGGMGGVQGPMGGGMMGGGMQHDGMDHDGMMGDGTCGCQAYCEDHDYEHNYSWDGNESGRS
ncbi:MAG: hypothetical protein ACT4OI_03905 [Methanobacteriota archaeon]